MSQETRQQVTDRILKALAEALGVPPERLAEGVDDLAEDAPEPIRENLRRALSGGRCREDTGTGR